MAQTAVDPNATIAVANPVRALQDDRLTESERKVLRLVQMLAAELVNMKSNTAQQTVAPGTAAPPLGASCGERWKHRFYRSNLLKFVQGRELETAEADAAMNTLALVAALLLTIPFSLIGGMNQQYWVQLASALSGCGHVELTARRMYAAIFNPLAALVYFSMGAIVMTVFYYLLRPNSDEFPAWWRRGGRYGVFLVFCFVGAAVVCTFTEFNTVVAMQFYMGFTVDLCDIANMTGPPYARYLTAVLGGMSVVILLMVVSIIFML